MQKLVLFFFIMIFLGGCTSNDTTGGFVQTATKTVSKTSCPYDCCLGSSDYYDKPCSDINRICSNFNCVLQDCPYKCCLGTDFKVKGCSSNYLECVSNECVQKECLYECCDGSTYSIKECAQYFSCSKNKCQPDDSDFDGLFDYEEVEIGTNPNLVDSDLDGWNDYKEFKIEKTNPTNENTDGDRYLDSVDSEPLITNSAFISYEISQINSNYNWLNILKISSALGLSCILTGGISCLEPLSTTFIITSLLGMQDTELLSPSYTIKLINNGTDYTNFIKFDSVIYINGNETKRILQEIGRLSVGESKEIEFSDPIQVKDLLNLDTLNYVLINIFAQSQIQPRIEYLQYEMFYN